MIYVYKLRSESISWHCAILNYQYASMCQCEEIFKQPICLIKVHTKACFFHMLMFLRWALVKWSQTFWWLAAENTRSIWPTSCTRGQTQAPHCRDPSTSLRNKESCTLAQRACTVSFWLPYSPTHLRNKNVLTSVSWFVTFKLLFYHAAENVMHVKLYFTWRDCGKKWYFI
jgi:hypothetical protein